MALMVDIKQFTELPMGFTGVPPRHERMATLQAIRR
jgi:hypothetical protein